MALGGAGGLVIYNATADQSATKAVPTKQTVSQPTAKKKTASSHRPKVTQQSDSAPTNYVVGAIVTGKQNGKIQDFTVTKVDKKNNRVTLQSADGQSWIIKIHQESGDK